MTLTAVRRARAAGLVGTALLAGAMSRRPGSRSFYLLTGGVAATWAAGALGDGPLTGEEPAAPLRHPTATPVLAGAAAFTGFACLAPLTRLVPALDRAVDRALSYVEQGSTPLVLGSACANGIAEEMYFRGRLWSLTQHRHPLLATTAAYTAMTSATRNPALVATGAAMGTLLGWQRSRAGGIRASAITHVTWSVLMIHVLPRLRGSGRLSRPRVPRDGR